MSRTIRLMRHYNSSGRSSSAGASHHDTLKTSSLQRSSASVSEVVCIGQHRDTALDQYDSGHVISHMPPWWWRHTHAAESNEPATVTEMTTESVTACVDVVSGGLDSTSCCLRRTSPLLLNDRYRYVIIHVFVPRLVAAAVWRRDRRCTAIFHWCHKRSLLYTTNCKWIMIWERWLQLLDVVVFVIRRTVSTTDSTALWLAPIQLPTTTIYDVERGGRVGGGSKRYGRGWMRRLVPRGLMRSISHH